MMRYTGVPLALALLLCSAPAAQQPRDNQRTASTGKARVTGVVVADDEEGRPLRRTRVMISGSELDLSRTAITSDEGVFSFDGLPAGHYTLTASKDGYVQMSFGASRPGRPGRPVPLSGAESRHVEFRLPRGAVITGVIRDPQGDPAPGVNVAILSRRFSPPTAERRLVPVPRIPAAVTDDRGVYRIFGLPAGSYLVTALPRLPVSAGEVMPVPREAVEWALQEARGRRTSPRPGMSPPLRPPPPAAERGARLAYAPTYFPGTIFDARATPIDLSAGQQRTGVDFDLDYVSLAIVEGFVTMPPGMRVQLTLMQADPASPYQATMGAISVADGRFVFTRVPPGHYAIHARAFPTSVRTGATPAESTFWARTEVIVSGENVDGVTLSLEPALTLTGQITFESNDAPVPVLENVRLPLQIGARGTSSAPFPSVLVNADRVTLQGVVPGPYRFLTPPLGIRSRAGRWWLKSIRIDGTEVLDEALTIAPTSKQLDVTFSDRASELSGRVIDESGAPVTGAFAVIFSENPASWFPHSRRVAAVRLNAEGRYAVWNLPAGRYLLAVSSDLENNEWFDPERLETLTAGAVRLTLAENEHKVLDIRQP
jgi:uncharacterized protein (DUF2141 family)